MTDAQQTGAMRVVFKDSGFADDVAKTNAAQILRQAGIDDVKSLCVLMNPGSQSPRVHHGP